MKTEHLLFDVEMEAAIGTDRCLLIVDEHVFKAHPKKLEKKTCYVLPSGEASKTLDEASKIIAWLHAQKADRNSVVVGVGGGMTTDLAGFVAGIYLRGVRCFLVPTTILAMCDAAIGGKNGVDLGFAKNIIGLIKTCDALIYDFSFLSSLPQEQWINGFAEIIKHAAIADAALFEMLQQNNLPFYKSHSEALKELIAHNIAIKQSIVSKDPYEQGLRRLLNFGHTLGHALELPHNLLHGQAIAIGMHFASLVSFEENGFSQNAILRDLLARYGLPVHYSFDPLAIAEQMFSDKKREGDTINFVVLKNIGEASTIALHFNQLTAYLKQFTAWQKA